MVGERRVGPRAQVNRVEKGVDLVGVVFGMGGGHETSPHEGGKGFYAGRAFRIRA